MYLLDSNILIYSLADHEDLLLHLSDLQQEWFYISAISRMEILVGVDKQGLSRNDTLSMLESIRTFPVTEEIVDLASEIFVQKHLGKSYFKDVIIAATAMIHNATLITADKGFKKFKGLEVRFLEI